MVKPHVTKKRVSQKEHLHRVHTYQNIVLHIWPFITTDQL